MNKLITLFILLFTVICYAQTEDLDKMELRNGQVLIGKVEKIKIAFVEFRENETKLIYETAKKDIRYIQLSSGKILTFEDYYQPEQKDEQQPPKQPVVVKKENGTSALPIVILIGVLVVGVIVIFGGF